MLTPSYLRDAVEPAEEIADKLHTDILARVVERILKRFARGDEYILTPLDKYQLETLQEAGYLLEDIQREIAAATGKMQDEIAQAMEDAGTRTLEYDDKIYRAAGLNPLPLIQSPYMIRLMQDIYEKTLGEWTNFTATTADAAQRLFIESCDMAYTQVMSGALGRAQAVKEAVDKAIAGGVEVVYSDTGWRDTIEVATARAVRTGIAQASARIQEARMDEMGWDIVLVSSHLGARVTKANDYTNHSWWQGKFYSRSGTDSRFPPFSVCGLGHVQGIEGANCRHSYMPGDGVNNPFERYDSEENRKMYEKEQRQRLLERRIRKTKRKVYEYQKAMDAARNGEEKAEFEKDYRQKAALLEKQNTAYAQYCKDNNLKQQRDRIMIAKWDREQAAKARAAAKAYNNAHKETNNA